ncbi:uncharacterized protein [Periplaneta americana]|uniref:uncharacterized protein n=1 Tax=Periplaneta americana TaxID=6978 RepID=UPI0037E7AD36
MVTSDLRPSVHTSRAKTTGIVDLCISAGLLLMLIVEATFISSGNGRLAILITTSFDLNNLAKFEDLTTQNKYCFENCVDDVILIYNRHYVALCFTFLLLQCVASSILVWATMKNRKWWCTMPWFVCKGSRVLSLLGLFFYYYVKGEYLPLSSQIAALFQFASDFLFSLLVFKAVIMSLQPIRRQVQNNRFGNERRELMTFDDEVPECSRMLTTFQTFKANNTNNESGNTSESHLDEQLERNGVRSRRLHSNPQVQKYDSVSISSQTTDIAPNVSELQHLHDSNSDIDQNTIEIIPKVEVLEKASSISIDIRPETPQESDVESDTIQEAESTIESGCPILSAHMARNSNTLNLQLDSIAESTSTTMGPIPQSGEETHNDGQMKPVGQESGNDVTERTMEKSNAPNS